MPKSGAVSISKSAVVAPETVARIGGWATLLAFFGISASKLGFFVAFHPPFTRIEQGEATLWLASVVLLAPAGLLLGYGYAAFLAPKLTEVVSWLRALSVREQRLGALSLTLIAVALARLANEIVMMGYPVTDDEWAARFGGEMLAQGRKLVDLPFSLEAFPWLFMFVRGNALTSMDWLGTQLAWTISTLTHTGNWVFAISAALPVPCIVWLLSRRLSPGWGVFGACLFIVSPMAFALSMTMHGHLHSRAFLAVMVAAHVWGLEKNAPAAGALRGLALGLALICRPFETLFFAAPLIVNEGWASWRERGPRAKAYLLGVVAALLPIALFVAHAHWVTNGWLPPRHTEGHTGSLQSGISLWQKFGSNTSFNLMRLGVWFAGPIGIILVVFGVMTDRFTKLLAWGVFGVLALGLFHDNVGIQAVGPIHYSECAVPLTILATFGLANLVRTIRAAGFDARVPVVTVTVALGVTSFVFNAVQSVALNDSSHIQADVYSRLEALVPESARPAIVLAPQFGALWSMNDAYYARGSWVFEWRRPKPDFSDDVLILRESRSNPEVLPSVRAAFPTRAMFRIVPTRDEDLFTLSPVLGDSE